MLNLSEVSPEDFREGLKADSNEKLKTICMSKLRSATHDLHLHLAVYEHAESAFESHQNGKWNFRGLYRRTPMLINSPLGPRIHLGCRENWLAAGAQENTDSVFLEYNNLHLEP